eukprot:2532859-Karenia_brevis.AAC.1
MGALNLVVPLFVEAGVTPPPRLSPPSPAEKDPYGGDLGMDAAFDFDISTPDGFTTPTRRA